MFSRKNFKIDLGSMIKEVMDLFNKHNLKMF